MRRSEREAYLASDEGRAEMEERKRRLEQSRRSPEFRAKQAQYQRDYKRAMRLLDISGGHATPDDIIWMSTNPVYKRLKAKREEAEREAREEAERLWMLNDEQKRRFEEQRRKEEEFFNSHSGALIDSTRATRRKGRSYRMLDLP